MVLKTERLRRRYAKNKECVNETVAAIAAKNKATHGLGYRQFLQDRVFS